MAEVGTPAAAGAFGHGSLEVATGDSAGFGFVVGIDAPGTAAAELAPGALQHSGRVRYAAAFGLERGEPG